MSSFRQQLKQFFAKTFKGYYLTVTTPKKFLIDCGVPDLPIVIRPSKLKEKMEQHDLTKDDLKNLGTLINSPLMVFHSQNDGRFDTAFSIITEREGSEGLLCVILYINEVINKIEVNNIASIHFRNINSLIKWTEDGCLIDSDIDKTKKIFSDSWHNASKCEYLLSLLDDAKVKHNSELAKNNGKNLQGVERRYVEVGSILSVRGYSGNEILAYVVVCELRDLYIVAQNLDLRKGKYLLYKFTYNDLEARADFSDKYVLNEGPFYRKGDVVGKRYVVDNVFATISEKKGKVIYLNWLYNITDTFTNKSKKCDEKALRLLVDRHFAMKAKALALYVYAQNIK